MKAIGKPFRAFEVLNLGRYERHAYLNVAGRLTGKKKEQALARKEQEFRDLILKAYRAEPLGGGSIGPGSAGVPPAVSGVPPETSLSSGAAALQKKSDATRKDNESSARARMTAREARALPHDEFSHAKQGNRLVVVGPINLPVGRLFVEEVITECRKRGASRVDVLAFEFEMGLFPAVLEEAKQKGIDLAPKTIPPEVFDKRAVEPGQVRFHDVACHFLASCILRHKEHGQQIRDILARRFPAVFVDELQDTGFFLARAFLALFSEERVSGLVVGDPNQAIYGFGGASPSIFDDFEKLPGAKTLRLKLSQRCPKAVSKVVTALSASGEAVESLPQAALGSASLVVHDLDDPNLTPPQANYVRSLLHGCSLAVIARKTSTANGLKGADVRGEFQVKSKAARRLNLAVQHLLGGEPREAGLFQEKFFVRLTENTQEVE